MIDEEVTAVVLAIIVVAGTFAASQALLAGRVVEPFSELGLLGPKMKIGDYPKAVLANDTFKLYLYVGNHEGRVMYYVVLAKLGDRATFINETVPADAPVIATYEVILPHGHNVTVPVELSIPEPKVNARLIFEMWVLDGGELKYHGRWVQLWVNVTAPAVPKI